MNRWLRALLLVAGVWLILVGSFQLLLPGIFNWIGRFGFDSLTRAERTEQFLEDAGGLSRLQVEAMNGKITLVGAETNQIEVEVTYRVDGVAGGSAEARLERMQTRVEREGSELRIIADYGTRNPSNQSINYYITLPRGLTTKASSMNGSIESDGLAGHLDLFTMNGTVRAEAEQGPQTLRARTTNGNIQVEIAAGAEDYDLQTTNGNVIVVLPPELGLELQARTTNGSIELGGGEWSLAGGKLSSKEVDARRGDGSLRLVAKTTNGDVEIEEK
ncbi:MAG: DUF4097 family beta strand repeat-containing protein [Bacillota bacterium]|jgi:hypothetical protein